MCPEYQKTRTFYMDSPNCGFLWKKHITNFCRLNPWWNRHFLVESHIEQWQIAVGTRSKAFQNNQPPGCQKRSLRWEITSFWQENSPSHYPSPVSLFTSSDENPHCCWTELSISSKTKHLTQAWCCMPAPDEFPLGCWKFGSGHHFHRKLPLFCPPKFN